MPFLPRARRTRLFVEPLEARVVPATLVNPKTVTYSDFDGDAVTVRFSKPILNPDNVNRIFTFGTGTVAGDNGTPQQLRQIELWMENPAPYHGLGITITARPTRLDGDGQVNVGAIYGDPDLGSVTIPGDLGGLMVGDDNRGDTALGSLSVASMGRFGKTTGGNLEATVAGPVGSIRIASDLVGMDWHTGSGGSVGLLSVGGDLIGEFTFNRAQKVVIGGNLAGSILAFEDIGSLSIGGSILEGEIDLEASVGTLSVGGDIIGGPGIVSGRVYIVGNAGRVTVGGDVVGGSGEASGRIDVYGTVGSASVGGSIVGAAGRYSGGVSLEKGAQSLVIGGSVIGAAGDSSGQMGLGRRSGRFRLGGDLIGGSGDAAGILYIGGNLDTFTIGGDLVGGSKAATAQVYVGNGSRVGAMTVGGSLVGGSGASSGCIMASGAVDTIAIGGDMRGGSNRHSGAVFVDREVRTMSVGGSLIGGTATADDADLLFSAGVNVRGRFGRLTVGGSVIGGSAGGFANVVLSGSGAIRGGLDIGTVEIRGSVIGRDDRIRLVAVGREVKPGKRVAFGSVSIGGRIQNAEILAGYDLDPDSNTLTARDRDVTVGPVSVGGDWIATELLVGVDRTTGLPIPGPNPQSRITSLTVGGQMFGTAATGDTYRVLAHSIGTIRIGGTAIGPLAAGPGNDSITGFGVYDDVTIQEVG